MSRKVKSISVALWGAKLGTLQTTLPFGQVVPAVPEGGRETALVCFPVSAPSCESPSGALPLAVAGWQISWHLESEPQCVQQGASAPAGWFSRLLGLQSSSTAPSWASTAQAPAQQCPLQRSGSSSCRFPRFQTLPYSPRVSGSRFPKLCSLWHSRILFIAISLLQYLVNNPLYHIIPRKMNGGTFRPLTQSWHSAFLFSFKRGTSSIYWRVDPVVATYNLHTTFMWYTTTSKYFMYF